MRYQMLRLFLTEKEVPPLYQEADYEYFKKQTRSQYLESIFKENQEFLGWSNIPYRYVYIGKEKSVLLGRVGRIKTEWITSGPETKFQEQPADLWHASNVLINIDSGPDGQKIAFEENKEVGKPLSIFKYWVSHINQVSQEARWNMAVNAIIKPSEFWDVIEKYQGQITQVDMTLVSPNLFNITDNLSDEMKTLQKEIGMEEVNLQVTNRNGALRPDNDRIRTMMDYIFKGGGSSRVRTKKKKVFDSRDHAVREDVEEKLQIPLERGQKANWKAFVNRFFGI